MGNETLVTLELSNCKKKSNPLKKNSLTKLQNAHRVYNITVGHRPFSDHSATMTRQNVVCPVLLSEQEMHSCNHANNLQIKQNSDKTIPLSYKRDR